MTLNSAFFLTPNNPCTPPPVLETLPPTVIHPVQIYAEMHLFGVSFCGLDRNWSLTNAGQYNGVGQGRCPADPASNILSDIPIDLMSKSAIWLSLKFYNLSDNNPSAASKLTVFFHLQNGAGSPFVDLFIGKYRQAATIPVGPQLTFRRAAQGGVTVESNQGAIVVEIVGMDQMLQEAAQKNLNRTSPNHPLDLCLDLILRVSAQRSQVQDTFTFYGADGALIL